MLRFGLEDPGPGEINQVGVGARCRAGAGWRGAIFTCVYTRFAIRARLVCLLLCLQGVGSLSLLNGTHPKGKKFNTYIEEMRENVVPVGMASLAGQRTKKTRKIPNAKKKEEHYL